MRKIIFIALALCSMHSVTMAQQAGNWRSIRLSVGYVGGEMNVGSPALDTEGFVTAGGSSNILYAEANLWNFNHFSMGGYLGGSKGCYATPSEIPGAMDIISTVSLHYGVSLTAHMLSLSGVESTKWDIELKGSLGSFLQLYATPQAEYNIGVSVLFYPFRHWGVFVESQWGKFVFFHPTLEQINQGTAMVKGGISFRF